MTSAKTSSQWGTNGGIAFVFGEDPLESFDQILLCDFLFRQFGTFFRVGRNLLGSACFVQIRIALAADFGVEWAHRAAYLTHQPLGLRRFDNRGELEEGQLGGHDVAEGRFFLSQRIELLSEQTHLLIVPDPVVIDDSDGKRLRR